MRGQRGALARAGLAGDQDQPARQVGQRLARSAGRFRLVEGGHRVGMARKAMAMRVPLVVGVDAEAPDARASCVEKSRSRCFCRAARSASAPTMSLTICLGRLGA